MAPSPHALCFSIIVFIILVIQAPLQPESRKKTFIAIENACMNGFFFEIKNFCLSIKEISILKS